MSGAFELPLHVETRGRGPGPDVETFVLLHGYGASSFTWRYWAGPLGDRGHVVLVDLMGFGSAPKPSGASYGPEHQAELVRRLLVQRGLRGVTLVGHSLGGAVALLTALHFVRADPGRICRLVLVSGVAYEQRLPPFVWLAHHPRLSTLLMKILGPRRVIRRVLRSIVFDPDGVGDGQVEGYADPLRGPGALAALIRAALEIVPDRVDELVSRYGEIDVPALLVWGRHDRVVPLWVGERLSADLPRARLEVLDECGHMPAEERPRESFALVEAFLDDTPYADADPPGFPL